MNLLYINHYAGSSVLGREFRPFYLAKEWIKQGHSVTLVGASYSHLRYNQPIVKADFDTDWIDGIRYVWIKTPEYISINRRILNILSFVFKLFYHSKHISQEFNPDIVIASSTYPFDIYAANRIARKSGARLCFEIHDLWPLSPMLIGGYSRWHPFILVMQMAENFAYKKSDLVISLLDKALPYMLSHGLIPEKFKVIPNGYCSEEWEKDYDPVTAEHEKLLSGLKYENKIIIGYSGGHSPSNALETLVSAAKILVGRKDLAFILVGDGPEKKSIMKLVDSEGLTNIHFLPAVSKRSIPDLISRFDMTYMGGIKSVLHQYGTSFNKMTDYMLSAKPIIFSVDEPLSLIDRLRCGITVPAEDHKAVADAILKIAALNTSERTEMGLRGKKYAEKELEYSILSKRMLDYITSAQNQHSSLITNKT